MCTRSSQKPSEALFKNCLDMFFFTFCNWIVPGLRCEWRHRYRHCRLLLLQPVEPRNALAMSCNIHGDPCRSGIDDGLRFQNKWNVATILFYAIELIFKSIVVQVFLKVLDHFIHLLHYRTNQSITFPPQQHTNQPRIRGGHQGLGPILPEDTLL